MAIATTTTRSTPTTIAVRIQPRPSLPVWTSFLASSSSVNGQNPEPVSLVPPEVESTPPREAVVVARWSVRPAPSRSAARAASAAARAAAGTRRSVLANSGRLRGVLEGRRRGGRLARRAAAGPACPGPGGPPGRSASPRDPAPRRAGTGVGTAGWVASAASSTSTSGEVWASLVEVRHAGGQRVAVDRDRGLGVHAGDVERRGHAGVAEVVGQGGGDLVRGLDRHRVLRGLLVQHPLADDVEGAGHPGAHLAGTQRAAALPWRAGYAGRGDSGPPAGQPGVEDPGEVDHVGLTVVELAVQRVRRAAALEAGVDDVPDQLDRAGVRDQHRLGVQPAVGDALGVPGGDRVGHLAGQPGRARGRQRALLEHQVQGDAVAPLVDHPGDAALVVAVEHAEQVGVGDGGRDPGGLEQSGGALVVAGHGVDGHAAGQDGVGRAPEAGALALGEQVVEAVAAGEDGAGSDRSGRRGPRSRDARGAVVTSLPSP